MDRLSIGEVCSLLQVKPHIVRYWEQGIDLLSPRKDFSGRRAYSDHDVQILSRVKYLVQERRFTLEGARERIYAELSGESGERNASRKAALQQVRHELLQAGRLLAQLRRSAAASQQPARVERSHAAGSPPLSLRVIRNESGEHVPEGGSVAATAAATIIGGHAADFDWQTEVRAVMADAIGRYATLRVIFCRPDLAAAVEAEAQQVADAETGQALVFTCEPASVWRAMEELRVGTAGRDLSRRGVRDLAVLPPDGPDVHDALGQLLSLHRRHGACFTLQATRRPGGGAGAGASKQTRFRMTGAIAIDLRQWRAIRESVPFTGTAETVENRAGGAYSGEGAMLVGLAGSVPCGIIVEYP